MQKNNKKQHITVVTPLKNTITKTTYTCQSVVDTQERALDIIFQIMENTNDTTINKKGYYKITKK